MKTQGNLGKKILLVDDEPSVSKAIKMLLEHDGHHVRLAHNGETALALFEQDRFDLIITDFSMPGMTGGELAGRIKQIRPGQPILMATASISNLDPANHPRHVVDFILDKPFSLQDLREAIARICPS